MSDLLIQHVSDTAYWIAAYRARETERADALFRDPLAARLAAGHGIDVARHMGSSEIMQWSVSLRTYIIDDFIRRALAQGVDTIVNLGAGLDTRPYRLPLTPAIHWIEVDFPQVIDFKEAQLLGEAAHCHLERVRLDLSDTQARDSLFTRIASTRKSVLLLTEGVMPYLSLEEAGSLATALSRQKVFNYWITDYFAPEFRKLFGQGRFGKRLGANAPFRFFPQNWQEFYRERGWPLQEMRYLSEEGATSAPTAAAAVGLQNRQEFSTAQNAYRA